MPDLVQAHSWYKSPDPVHGFDHIQRVYYLAKHLALKEGADLEIVCAAVLLHDVNSPEASDVKVPTIDSVSQEPEKDREIHQYHAAQFARTILGNEGWEESRIEAVVHCIEAHRYRGSSMNPLTLEAKVVFDADKLDAIGAIGIARALAYSITHNHPIYSKPSEQFLQNGQLLKEELHSSYHEYLFKLRHIKNKLFTKTAKEMAEKRHKIMESFFRQLVDEIELLG